MEVVASFAAAATDHQGAAAGAGAGAAGTGSGAGEAPVSSSESLSASTSASSNNNSTSTTTEEALRTQLMLREQVVADQAGLVRNLAADLRKLEDDMRRRALAEAVRDQQLRDKHTVLVSLAKQYTQVVAVLAAREKELGDLQRETAILRASLHQVSGMLHEAHTRLIEAGQPLPASTADGVVIPGMEIKPADMLTDDLTHQQHAAHHPPPHHHHHPSPISNMLAALKSSRSRGSNFSNSNNNYPSSSLSASSSLSSLASISTSSSSTGSSSSSSSGAATATAAVGASSSSSRSPDVGRRSPVIESLSFFTKGGAFRSGGNANINSSNQSNSNSNASAIFSTPSSSREGRTRPISVNDIRVVVQSADAPISATVSNTAASPTSPKLSATSSASSSTPDLASSSTAAASANVAPVSPAAAMDSDEEEEEEEEEDQNEDDERDKMDDKENELDNDRRKSTPKAEGREADDLLNNHDQVDKSDEKPSGESSGISSYNAPPKKVKRMSTAIEFQLSDVVTNSLMELPEINRYDEYGFLQLSAAPSANEKALMDAQEITHREKWDAYLAEHNLTIHTLPEKQDYQLKMLIRSGIPKEYRPVVWLRTSGAMEMRENGYYDRILSEHAGVQTSHTKQVELDVRRTIPTNLKFSDDDTVGTIRLRRILTAYSWRNPAVGYCQGMNLLCACLILVHPNEEDAFWNFCALMEKILPAEYYSPQLLTSQADQRVLKDMIAERCPKLIQHMESLGVELSMITFNWLACVFVDSVPTETLFRIWDVFLNEGIKVLFRFSIALMRSNERAILACDSPDAIFALLKKCAASAYHIDDLTRDAFDNLKPFPKKKIIVKREKYEAQIRLELEAIEKRRREFAKAHSMSAVGKL